MLLNKYARKIIKQKQDFVPTRVRVNELSRQLYGHQSAALNSTNLEDAVNVFEDDGYVNLGEILTSNGVFRFAV